MEQQMETTAGNMEQEIESFLTSGGTLAMLKEISADELEQFYTLAYNLYQSGKQQDAMAVFQLLCMLDHYDSRFFLGLGACRQATENWSAALETYSFATFLDVNDPRFPFHAAECLMQLSDFDGAQCGFESARLLATDKPEYEDIVLQAETMLDVINIKREQQNERNHH